MQTQFNQDINILSQDISLGISQINDYIKRYGINPSDKKNFVEFFEDLSYKIPEEIVGEYNTFATSVINRVNRLTDSLLSKYGYTGKFEDILNILILVQNSFPNPDLIFSLSERNRNIFDDIYIYFKDRLIGYEYLLYIIEGTFGAAIENESGRSLIGYQTSSLLKTLKSEISSLNQLLDAIEEIGSFDIIKVNGENRYSFDFPDIEDDSFYMEENTKRPRNSYLEENIIKKSRPF